MTITLLLMVGVISVAFARPNRVAFEGSDYLAELEESIEKENNIMGTYEECQYARFHCRQPPPVCDAQLHQCLANLG